jgi:hypothetical protein
VKSRGSANRADRGSTDEHHLHRGYWEAKETDDKLETEIKMKIAKGCPLTNTIFEGTRQAVLL